MSYVLVIMDRPDTSTVRDAFPEVDGQSSEQGVFSMGESACHRPRGREVGACLGIRQQASQFHA